MDANDLTRFRPRIPDVLGTMPREGKAYTPKNCNPTPRNPDSQLGCFNFTHFAVFFLLTSKNC